MENIHNLEANSLIVLKNDLDNIPDICSKIAFLLSMRSVECINKYGKGIWYKVVSALRKDGDEYLGGLRRDVFEVVNALSSAEDIDNFFSSIFDKAFFGLSEEEKYRQMAHNAGHLIGGILDEWWRILPRDASALEIWYGQAKFFMNNTSYIDNIADVYMRNIDDARSKEFFDKFVLGGTRHVKSLFDEYAKHS